MRIAITGPAGHIGSNLIPELVGLGHEVRVLIYDNPRPLQKFGLTGVRGDVFNPACLQELFHDAEVVFHLAGKISIDGDPDGSVMRVNVEGTKNVVEACLACGVKRLIHFSSIHAMQQDPLDEDLDERRSYVGDNGFVYDRSVYLGEKEILKGIEKGLDAVILIPTAILGPLDYKPSLMGKGLIDLYHGKIPSLVPGGFDWVDVRDVVGTAIRAMTEARAGERYILSGTWVSMKEFTEMIESLTGKKAPRFTSPTWLANLGLPLIKLYGKLRRHPPVYTKEAVEVLRRCNPHIRREKAVRELQHHPRPLQDTLTDTYSWYQSQGMIR